MKRISLLLGVVLVACHTPDLDELAKTEIRVLRAPAAATRVRVIAGGAVREAALVDRGATLLFGALPDGDAPRATAIDAEGHDLETLTSGKKETAARVVISFDFRPCEIDARFGKSCTSGLGECAAAGTWRCADDHVSVACDATPLPPGHETCNGKDDDCDGDTDEQADLEPPRCELTAGACADWTRTCQGAGGWSACDYGADYEAVETRCDGKDNDCDGKVDPMIGVEAASCGGCNAPCTGDASCVSGRCYDVPAVVFSSLHDDDWGVAQDTAITLRFSRAMDQASVRSAIAFSPAASFTAQWNGAGTEAVVRPSTPLAASTRYVFSVSVAAKDTHAKALSEPFSATFSTSPTPGLFVWGGNSDTPPYEARDAWMLVLVPGAAARWYPLDTSSSGPTPRYGVLVAEDAKRQRVLLAGGVSGLGDTTYSEVWAFSAHGGNAGPWSRIVDDVPGAGFGRGMGGVDAARDELVIYGGTRGNACIDTALRLSLATPAALQSLSTAGALPGLREPAWVWAASRRTLWITQGYGDMTAPNCWRPPSTSQLSSPKTYALTLDAAGFSGTLSTYEISFGRGEAAAATDGTQYVVYGGDGGSHADEAWLFDGSGWHLLTPSGSAADPMRSGSMIYDPVGARYVTFGGFHPNTANNNNAVHAFTVSGGTASWTLLAPRGTAPSARSSFAYTSVVDAGPYVPVH